MSFVRAGHFGACMLLFGVFVFLTFIAEPAFRRAGVSPDLEFAEFDGWPMRLAVWSLLVELVSAALWLVLEASAMSGQAASLPIIGSVLARTHFGRVWTARLLLSALLGGILFFAKRDKRLGLFLRYAGAAIGGALLASLASAGHAAAGKGGAGAIHWTCDAAHLLLAGGWLGGLAALVPVLHRARKSTTRFRIAMMPAIARRFSNMGVVVVAGLTLTGCVNAWFLVGSLEALAATGYGQLLLVKLGLFALMLLFAAANRFRLVPQISALAHAESMQPGKAVRNLYRNVVFELCLGAAIVLIVGTLGMTPPPAHASMNMPTAR